MNRRRDEHGNPLVACQVCGNDTPMLGTRRCDRCYELETRIHSDPELARQILQRFDAERTPA